MQLIRGPAASWPDTIAFRDPAIATRIALPSLAGCILELSTEIDELDELIAPLVEVLAPQMLRRVGCGVQIVGQLLVTAGDNPERLSSEDRDDALVAEFHKNDPRAIRRALRLSFHYLDRHGSVAAYESGVRAWVVSATWTT